MLLMELPTLPLENTEHGSRITQEKSVFVHLASDLNLNEVRSVYNGYDVTKYCSRHFQTVSYDNELVAISE